MHVFILSLVLMGSLGQAAGVGHTGPVSAPWLFSDSSQTVIKEASSQLGRGLLSAGLLLELSSELFVVGLQ